MSAIALPSRQEVEDLLYREAALLDEWRLEEWLELLTDDAVYQVPSTDAPEGDARNTLYIIADDALRIRSRVKQLLGRVSLGGKSTFPHSPDNNQRSRSRRRGRQYPGDRQLRSLPDALRDGGYLCRPL
jgi:p-cumate 2,3-dioxygenase subunit beta